MALHQKLGQSSASGFATCWIIPLPKHLPLSSELFTPECLAYSQFKHLEQFTYYLRATVKPTHLISATSPKGVRTQYLYASSASKKKKTTAIWKTYHVELQRYIALWLPEVTWLYVPDAGSIEPRKSFHSLIELQHCILWQLTQHHGNSVLQITRQNYSEQALTVFSHTIDNTEAHSPLVL